MCVDSLIELIDNRVQTKIDKSAYINSLVGQVTSVGIDKCGVKLLTTGVTYNLPNYSGSNVYAGEMVYVYCKGGFLSEQTAYIGASVTSPTNITYLYAVVYKGGLSSSNKVVASWNFTTITTTSVNLVFNAVIASDTSDTVTFTTYIDGEEYDYVTFITVADGYTHCNFVLPIDFDGSESHKISIKASGVGSITQIISYLFGTSLTESEWVLTSEEDYIYIINNNEVKLLFYIGSYKRIITPTTIENLPVVTIGNSCFVDSQVEAVIVADSVLNIE